MKNKKTKILLSTLMLGVGIAVPTTLATMDNNIVETNNVNVVQVEEVTSQDQVSIEQTYAPVEEPFLD